MEIAQALAEFVAEGAPAEGDASDVETDAPEDASETDAPEGEAPEDTDDEPDDADDPDSDDADDDPETWTPERIQEERASLKAERERLQKFHGVEKKRAAKRARQQQEFLTERKQFDTQKAQVLEDIKVARTGSGAQVLDAIQRLAGGRDPYEIYKEMSLALAGKAPTEPKPSPETEALRKEIEAIKAQRAAETHAQALAREQKVVIDMLTEESFPLIKGEFDDDPRGTIADIGTFFTRYYERNGKELDYATGLAQLESQFRAHLESKARRLGLQPPAGTAGLDTSATAKTRGRETPTKRHGTTVTQRAGSTPASKRPQTDAERIESAAEFIPDFLVAASRG